VGLMNSKGPSPVTHIDQGDDAPDTRSTRRALLGAGIGVSVLGAALAGATGRAGASSVLADADDSALLRAAMELELAARDLYDEAIAAGADPLMPRTMREQHESYAQAIAGASGFSANTRNDQVFDGLSGSFATSDTQALAEVAYELESTALATHLELLGVLTDPGAVRIVASIVSIVARHCAVLADAAGRGDDLDALITLDADPLPLEDLV